MLLRHGWRHSLLHLFRDITKQIFTVSLDQHWKIMTVITEMNLHLCWLDSSIIRSIPTSIKNCSSLYSFKRHLKSHLIAQLINNQHTPSGHLVTCPRLRFMLNVRLCARYKFPYYYLLVLILANCYPFNQTGFIVFGLGLTRHVRSRSHTLWSRSHRVVVPLTSLRNVHVNATFTITVRSKLRARVRIICEI